MSERDEFEEWANVNGYDVRYGRISGSYFYTQTDNTWQGWQAALASMRESGPCGLHPKALIQHVVEPAEADVCLGCLYDGLNGMVKIRDAEIAALRKAQVEETLEAERLRQRVKELERDYDRLAESELGGIDM